MTGTPPSPAEPQDAGGGAASGPGRAPRTRTRARIRRQRSATESLVSIACILEAVVLFFIALTVFGLKALPAPVALGGGFGLILLFFVAAGVARWRAGLVFGAVLQVVFLVAAFVQIGAGVVAVLFVALWVFCLVRGIQLDRANARAASAPAVPPAPTQGEP